jgi:hypothetical protein
VDRQEDTSLDVEEQFDQTEDDQERNREVVFRFVNFNDSETRRCPPAFELFSPFDPNPEALRDLTLFQSYISVTDFELVLDTLNEIIEWHRTLSKWWLVLVILLSFGSLFVSIFAEPYIGVSLQLFFLIIYVALQSWTRRRCIERCNLKLEEEINPPLRQSRNVYCKIQYGSETCRGWLEWDLCQTQAELRTAALETSAVVNPLSSAEIVQRWEESDSSPMDREQGRAKRRPKESWDSPSDPEVNVEPLPDLPDPQFTLPP